jgi:hypothetical protein
MNTNKWIKIKDSYPKDSSIVEVIDSVGKIGRASYRSSGVDYKGWLFEEKFNYKDFNTIEKWRKIG